MAVGWGLGQCMAVGKLATYRTLCCSYSKFKQVTVMDFEGGSEP